MKRIILILSSVALFTAFIIPAYKMSDLTKSGKKAEVLVLKGSAFFNLGSAYINRAVPSRIIITSSGYIRQDYTFPKAVVSIIHEGTTATVIINRARLKLIPAIFVNYSIFGRLMKLYLSDNPLRVYAEMGLNVTQVAYGLANDRAAYIIGNNNDQLFIDNEKKVPIMYRIKRNNVYTEAIVKNYLSGAELVQKPIRFTGSDNQFMPLKADSYTETTAIIPETVELYAGNVLMQKWIFTKAFLFPKESDIKQLILTPATIKRLQVSPNPISPFMLF